MEPTTGPIRKYPKQDRQIYAIGYMDTNGPRLNYGPLDNYTKRLLNVVLGRGEKGASDFPPKV
jgi:hypothetical protein